MVKTAREIQDDQVNRRLEALERFIISERLGKMSGRVEALERTGKQTAERIDGLYERCKQLTSIDSSLMNLLATKVDRGTSR